MAPHSISVDEELNEAAREVMIKMKAESDGILNPEYLQQYAIVDKEGEFEKAIQNGIKASTSSILSVKSDRKKMDKQGANQETNKRKGKDGEKLKSNKKKRT